jgi:hypothetical protein
MTRRKIGTALLLLGNLLLIYISLSAPPYARAHSHLDPRMLAQYAGPWPVALGCSLALAGIMLALVPIRRGERWAWWTSLGVFAILFIARITTDPRCLVVLDPHQHGCHTFIVAVALGVAGLITAWRRGK